MEKIRLAQIGCGYWGPNLLRNFYSMRSVSVAAVVEPDPSRIEYIRAQYKDIEITDDSKSILDDESIDAVVIATPAKFHYAQALEALNHGKHCFVEKPLALKTQEAEELVEIAERWQKVLMVGHIFLFNAAVRRLKEEIQKGTLGDVYYIYSQRLNLGRIRQDISAMWNFAPHDISILLYLLDSNPEWVSATGACYVQPDIEDVVFLTIGFANGILANIHISWLDPNKIRRITVVGTKQMIVYDDVSEYKIQIFDKGIERVGMKQAFEDYDTFGKFQLIHRAGDLTIPKIDFSEPLKAETQHFVDCILNRKEPLTNGRQGLTVTKILEAGQRSLQEGGMRIPIRNVDQR